MPCNQIRHNINAKELTPSCLDPSVHQMSIPLNSGRPYRGKQTRDDDEGCGPLYLVVYPVRIIVAFRRRWSGIELYVCVAAGECLVS